MRKFCIFTPDGTIPDIQILFGGVREENRVDSNVTVIGKEVEILLGLSCIIHDLTDSLGRDKVLPAIMIGLNHGGLFKSEDDEV